MSRVLVVSSHPPLAQGGHLTIGRSLVEALERAGHRAELVLTPQNRFGRQGAAYLATWLTDVGVAHDGHPIDRVISLRYPSYAVRHPRHVCWLNHTMREYYDLWDDFSAHLSARNHVKERIRRRLIWTADRYLLSRNVTKLFVQSSTVNERLRQTLGIAGRVLYPPPPDRAYRCESYEPFLLTVSRLTRHKRIDLILRALAAEPARHVRLVVLGEGEARDELEALGVSLGVADRVSWLGRVSEVTLLDHLARCRAVAFTPVSEDYGFVTTEAAACAKAVVTCRDSGGPAELVRDGESGLVSEPTPEALAVAVGHIMRDEAVARQLGHSANAAMGRWRWSAVVDTLLAV